MSYQNLLFAILLIVYWLMILQRLWLRILLRSAIPFRLLLKHNISCFLRAAHQSCIALCICKVIKLLHDCRVENCARYNCYIKNFFFHIVYFYWLMICAVGGIAPHNALYKRSTANDLLSLFLFKFDTKLSCNPFYWFVVEHFFNTISIEIVTECVVINII